MAGADGLINHTFEGLTQGVSEQTTESRRETQLDAMENCIPHLSRGVLRRNPVNFTSKLLDKDGVQLVTDDYFMYTYDRGTSTEQYLMLVGHRKWYVFNANTGTLVGSYNDTTNVGTNLDYLDTGGQHPKNTFSLVTVGDHTWISNNTITTAMSTQADVLPVAYHRTKAIYWVKSTGNVVTATNPSTGATTIEGYEYNVALGSESGTVVGGTASGALRGDEVANSLTVALNGGITAGTTVLRTQNTGFSKNYNSWANYTSSASTKIYWYGVLVYAGPSITGSYTVGKYTYYQGSNRDGGWFYVYRTWNEEVAGATTGLWKTTGPFVYKEGLPVKGILDWSDSFGNTASFGFKGIVSDSSKLPEILPIDIGDVVVKIDGSSESDTGDEYWLEWNGDSWTESMEPGLTNYLDESTLPHEFLRTETGAFTFGYYGEFQYDEEQAVTSRIGSSLWSERRRGDANTAPEPSFIGKKISDMFVHNNRLGFLAEDSIVLSELSEYGNFWPTTVRTIPATDPIDIIVATTDVTGLKKAVSLSGLLMLFSDDAQFSLSGGGASLTPETASVSSVSSYNYSNKAPARAIGNKVIFVTESGNGTQQFSFSVSDISSGAGSITAENSSLHIPTYLPNNIHYMQGHSILGYVFMLSPDEPGSIYVLNSLEINKQSAQSAYHKWTFGKDIKGISVLNNTLTILFNDSGVLSYGYISLDLPANHQAVSYLDDFDGITPEAYISKLRISKWHVKDANGFGTRRGRLQIRTAQFTTDNSDKYKVSVINDSIIQSADALENWVLTDGVWDDTAYWSYNATDTDDSSVYWKDGIPYYERIYYDDEKITVASNADTTFIEFSNNELDPSKGFALSTVNLEGMWRQRSQRF